MELIILYVIAACIMVWLTITGHLNHIQSFFWTNCYSISI